MNISEMNENEELKNKYIKYLQGYLRLNEFDGDQKWCLKDVLSFDKFKDAIEYPDFELGRKIFNRLFPVYVKNGNSDNLFIEFWNTFQSIKKREYSSKQHIDDAKFYEMLRVNDRKLYGYKYIERNR